MTSILLVCIVMLLMSRIKETPSMLNEKRYYDKVREVIKNNENFLNKLSYENVKRIERFTKIAAYFYSAALVLIYAAIGNSANSAYVNLLSFIQICTVVATMRLNRNVNPVSLYIGDFRFYRWYFLFNVVLDYVYYPLTFVLLLLNY